MIHLVKYIVDADSKLAHHDSNEQDGFTPLYVAAENGYLEVVTRLLDGHADVNLANKVCSMQSCTF